MLSELCDHSFYLRSMCASCCSLENSRGIVESLLNPRLISPRVSFSSKILQNEETFITHIWTALVSILFPIILWTNNRCHSLPGWYNGQLVFAEAHGGNRSVLDCIKHLIRYRCLLFFTENNKRKTCYNNWHEEHVWASGKMCWILAKKQNKKK